MKYNSLSMPICSRTATDFYYTNNPFWNKWVCLYLSRNRNRQRPCQTPFVYFNSQPCLILSFNYLWYISTLIDIIQLTWLNAHTIQVYIGMILLRISCVIATNILRTYHLLDFSNIIIALPSPEGPDLIGIRIKYQINLCLW